MGQEIEIKNVGRKGKGEKKRNKRRKEENEKIIPLTVLNLGINSITNGQMKEKKQKKIRGNNITWKNYTNLCIFLYRIAGIGRYLLYWVAHPV